MRVAVFQAEWPVQKQTANLVRMLSLAGYEVDVYLYRVPEHFETLNAVEQDSGVRVHRFNQQTFIAGAPQPGDRQGRKPRKFRYPIIGRLYSLAGGLRSRAMRMPQLLADWVCYTAHLGEAGRLLPRRLLAATAAKMDGRGYTALFGVEKMGLVWAGLMAQRRRTRMVYFSLELYTKGFPGLNDIRSRMLKRLECRFHKLSEATIIQDPERAEVLFSDTCAQRKTVFYIPVSILGPPILQRPRIIRDRLSISDGAVIILMFGNMFGVRYVEELVTAAQSFPKDWVLVLHGPWPGLAMLERLQVLDRGNKAVISTDMLPSDQVDEFVASADIGLALYPNRTQNEFLTGKSSEKVALYARAGVPVIAFDYPSFTSVFEKYNSGAAIPSVDQLSSGIRSILDRYSACREGSFRAYQEVYEFSQHFGQVERWLAKP